jgi:hypothetical protein
MRPLMITHPLVAVFLGLAILFGVAGVLGQRPTTQIGVAVPQPADTTSVAKPEQSSLPVATTPKQPEYKPDCSVKDNADLCAQRRIAKAAEEQTGINALGLGLLFFTLCATIAAALSVRQAAIATRHAATAAHGSANTANATLETMRDTAKRQLRAYVMVDGMVVGETFVKVVLKNAGLTPASNVAGRLTSHWKEGQHQDLPEGFAFPDYDDAVAAPLGFSALGSGQKQMMTFDINADKFKLAREGKLTLFALVRIDYSDVFGQGHPTVLAVKGVKRADDSFGFNVYGNYSRSD